MGVASERRGSRAGEVFQRCLQGPAFKRWQVAKSLLQTFAFLLRRGHLTRQGLGGGRMFLNAPGCLQRGHKREASGCKTEH